MYIKSQCFDWVVMENLVCDSNKITIPLHICKTYIWSQTYSTVYGKPFLTFKKNVYQGGMKMKSNHYFRKGKKFPPPPHSLGPPTFQPPMFFLTPLNATLILKAYPSSNCHYMYFQMNVQVQIMSKFCWLDQPAFF